MNKKEFKKRRTQIMRMIGKEGVAILPSAPIKNRSRDVEYRYRQDSDFYYLTGFSEPDAVCVIAPGRENGEYIVFCRERDREKEKWEGSRSGPDGLINNYSVDDAFPIDDIDDILPGIIESRDRLYYPMGSNPDFDKKINNWVKFLRGKIFPDSHIPYEFITLDHLLHDMRLYKSHSEISAMRRASKIAVEAHSKVMQRTHPGMYEYELEAIIISEFRKKNAVNSYIPIVGAGVNGCILHYVSNNSVLKSGDLVLIDAGCELNYYASDITRTFPVNGRFTPEQRAVYEIVLNAQNEAIEKAKEGNHWNDPHDAAVKVITAGLKKIGLLDGRLTTLVRDEAYREFFMHRTGHWIGMDVHDVGDYKVDDQWRLLEKGMVMTIEPGIYIPNHSKIPKKYRNIGIRIEDDVLVKKDGPDVLSKDLIKDPDAIETHMAS
jgi:Xaa-Pro aminopeptidase